MEKDWPVERTNPDPGAGAIAAIKQRAEKATPAPWWTGPHYVCDVESYHGGTIRSRALYSQQAAADAEFIAHARTDIPALLAYIDAQQ